MITGTVQKIQTLVDGSVRLSLDIPRELCPDNIMTWSYEEVEINKKGEDNGASKKEEGDNQDRPQKRKRNNY